ncbi:MAG: CDP-diacylglycerol--glycerol-3-phosphate 3-phosphatidyltransferase [Planctomycetes bacterium]|nr:CDP-diacylglycerol--glycerol-3-phosphate 3-phosphatidyltransferase [Planctomycetota bacterium]
MTLANKITLGRFLLSLVSFVALTLWGEWAAVDQTLLVVAYVIFLVVALSDMLDGWAARRYGEVTEVGRIADPMVDKIAVCGVLILTQRVAPIPELVPTWIIVVVVVREFVVTGIRAAAEAKGIPFPANIWGKLKAFTQNVLAAASIIYPAHTIGVPWCTWFVRISGWIVVLTTVVSGWVYVRQGMRVLKSKG